MWRGRGSRELSRGRAREQPGVEGRVNQGVPGGDSSGGGAGQDVEGRWALGKSWRCSGDLWCEIEGACAWPLSSHSCAVGGFHGAAVSPTRHCVFLTHAGKPS